MPTIAATHNTAEVALHGNTSSQLFGPTVAVAAAGPERCHASSYNSTALERATGTQSAQCGSGWLRPIAATSGLRLAAAAFGDNHAAAQCDSVKTDSFNKQDRPDQTRPDQTRPDQTRPD